MNRAIRTMSREGTCVVRLGWVYEEKEIVEQVLKTVPNPEYEKL